MWANLQFWILVSVGAAILLTFECFSILTRALEFFFFYIFRHFSSFIIHEIVRHAVSMIFGVLFHYMHRVQVARHVLVLSYPETYDRSNIVYGLWTENHVFNVMNTASAAPNYPSCCGTCARIANAKVCTTRGMNDYLFHISFCHSSHNVVCFVLPSSCTTAGRNPILLHDRIVEYIRTLHDYVPSTDSLALYSVPAPHTFLRLFGRPANTNYGRFGTGVERPMLVPSFYY